jgi:hypothetical protein
VQRLVSPLLGRMMTHSVLPTKMTSPLFKFVSVAALTIA